MFEFLLCTLLVLLGLWGVLTRHNLVKIALALSAMETGLNMMLIAVAYRTGGGIPIWPEANMVDPIPHALTLTSIVIGACITALALGLTVAIWRRFKTLDSRKMRELMG